jgi:DNA-binding NtrC family response regulator
MNPLGESSTVPAKKPRVLLVEDELAIARAYSRALSAAGLDVVHAGDGASAILNLEISTFDVVLSDVWMPGTDGIDVLRVARSRDQDVSVILITGAPSPEGAVKAAESGALLYLAKPFELRSLVQVVANGVLLTEAARKRRATPPDPSPG